MSMVQCPVCRYTFMQKGDACCWRCSPAQVPPTRDELSIARRIREGEDLEVGSAGSLAGLGFAPLARPLRVFEAPADRLNSAKSVWVHHIPYWDIVRTLAVVGWLCYVAYLVAKAAYRNAWHIR